MQNFADIDMTSSLVRVRLNERLAEAANDRLANEARRASPRFVPSSRLRDTAFWASIFGPLVGLGFLAYFANEIARTTIA